MSKSSRPSLPLRLRYMPSLSASTAKAAKPWRNNWPVKHWASLVVLLSLLSLLDPFSLLGAERAHAASSASGSILLARNSQTERRTSQLICTLSAFFSADAEQAFRARAHFDGRGLIVCKNDQGFSTELPVLADLEAQLSRDARRSGTEVTLSANSSSFVVPREISEAQDSFVVRPGIQSASDSSSSGVTTILLRGVRHDLVVEMKLNSQTVDIEGLKVTGLRLRFDDAAPDLL